MNTPLHLQRAANILWWIVLVAILLGSLTPKSPGPVTDFRDAHDDVLHAACYAALTGLRAFDPWRRQTLYFAAFFLLGVAIELIQPSVGRAFDTADILANTTGLLLGFLTAVAVRTISTPAR